jgi:hypothetical protein
VSKVTHEQNTEKFGWKTRPLFITIILSVTAAANGYASPAAFILPLADGLQSGDSCQTADSGCETTAAGSIGIGSGLTVTGNCGQADSDLDVPVVVGALPTTAPEPMSSVPIGAGPIGLGSFARRRRRPNE